MCGFSPSGGNFAQRFFPGPAYAGLMSVPVELAELSAAAAKHHFGYLVTVNDRGQAHVVAVQPVVGESVVALDDLGRRTMRNVSPRSPVTLLWPPAEVGGYSLIVDGEVEETGDASITIRPSRAVLHRPAPDHHDHDHAAGEACGHDCVELAVTARSTG